MIPNFSFIEEALFAPTEKTLYPPCYVILDGARDPAIFPFVSRGHLEKKCLYRGKLDSKIQEVAPYLLRLTSETRLSRDLMKQMWGHSWGIFLNTKIPIEELRAHLSQFIRVKDQRMRTFFFRFYDPRILRPFLPVCNRAELKTFFGPIERFWAEGMFGDTLNRYQLDPEGGLMTDEIPVTETEDMSSGKLLAD